MPTGIGRTREAGGEFARGNARPYRHRPAGSPAAGDPGATLPSRRCVVDETSHMFSELFGGTPPATEEEKALARRLGRESASDGEAECPFRAPDLREAWESARRSRLPDRGR